MITQPGLYPTVTADEYHADPVTGGSLSSSGARALLPPSCPARYHWQQINGQPAKRHFDFGHAAHRLVLGAGAELEIVEADDWRTKAAKEQRDDAYANGLTPILAAEYAVVEAMANAIRQHPVASALLDPQHGTPEQTLVWQDPSTKVMCRARFDWLPAPSRGRLIIPDYKTCASAEPEQLRRTMDQFGYHMQASWYLDAARIVLGARDPAFVFIAQEKAAPYIVTVWEPDYVALRIGAERNHTARSIWQQCTTTGHWPAYSDAIELLALPAWAEAREGARTT